MSSKLQPVCADLSQRDLIVENASNRVPPEIWVKIFEMIPKPTNLAKLRPVCKLWQAVIDENFDMKVKINDDKMDINSIILFKRVTECIVSKFVREVILPPPNQIFWDPKLLSNLIIRGSISRPNFLLIAQQCQNVKELYLTGSVLIGDPQLFEAVSAQETNILATFMSRLEKLVVSGLHIGVSEENPISVNLLSVLNWQMNSLKNLVVRISYPDKDEDNMFFQLLEHFDALESIEITLRSYNVSLQFNPFVVPNLNTLNIEINYYLRLVDWLPFISTQNTIKNLKIIVSDRTGFKLDEPVFDAVLKNKKSLQSLELGIICIIDNIIVAEFLRNLVALRSLILRGVRHPRLDHLDLLPQSLETLVLENFKVKRQEFRLIADRVVDLKTENLNF